MPGKHDGQQQVWIHCDVFDRLRRLINSRAGRLESRRFPQREHLDRAIKQYCQRQERQDKPKAKARKDH